MKRDSRYSSGGLLFLAAALALLLTPGCPPTSPCTGGPSILDIDDSGVSADIKNAVYASGNIIGMDDPGYPSRDIAIIPFQTNDYPSNPEVTRDAIITDFFTFNSISLANYFLETSYGHFWLHDAGISDVVTIQGNTTDFGVGQLGNDWTRNADLARQICQGSTLDWAELDKNHDLRITPNEVQVMFMTSIGLGGATRPSAVTITHNNTTYTVDQRFVYFDTLPQNDSRETTQGNIRYNFSTITHEMMHALFNLPDRYVDYCGSGGTGAYDLMSDNCGGMKHLNMHDKMKIGWVRPKVRMRDGVLADCMNFPASELTPAGLIINPVVTSTPAGNVYQYWVVENRFKPSSAFGDWDRALPESGICIWYVRQTPGADDEVHLIDALLPDQDPLAYVNQGAGALFKDLPGHPVGSHGLYLAGGVATSYGFGYMSAVGSSMYAQF